MKKEFKKGDKVKTVSNVFGEVVHVFSATEIVYPIMVAFDTTISYNTFTRDGRISKDGEIGITHIEEEKPQRPFLKGDRVESNQNGSGEVIFVGVKRYYAYPIVVGFDEGKYQVYTNDGRLTEEGAIKITHIDTPKQEDDFKVGDRVKDAAYGPGEVWRIDNASLYPMYVHCECGQTVQFGMNGKHIGAPLKTLQKI